MGSVNDIIDAFRFVVDGKSLGVVAAVSHSRHHEHAICFVAVDNHRSHVRDGLGVEFSSVRALEGSRACRLQIVALARLVVDDGYAA